MSAPDALVINRFGHGRWAVPAGSDLTILIITVDQGTVQATAPALGVIAPEDVLILKLDAPFAMTIDPRSVAITAQLTVDAHDMHAIEKSTVLRAEARSATSVLRHALLGLSADGPLTGVNTGPRVHQQLNALVTAALAEQVAARRHGNAQVFLDARHFVESRLPDPELGQEQIAAALNVSTRTLYRAFRAHDVTVSEWIRRRRLQHCRTDLQDVRLIQVPVSTLAAQWGLPDAAHFSRLFKAEYGSSPRDFRERSMRAAGSLVGLELAV